MRIIALSVVLLALIGCTAEISTMEDIESQFGKIEDIRTTMVTLYTETHEIDAVCLPDGYIVVTKPRKR